MGYTNSPLISKTVLSPNNSGTRTHAIDRITPHCIVGQWSIDTIGNYFKQVYVWRTNATTGQKEQVRLNASCNYGIGTDGRSILCVDESMRSWCSSSNENDQRAITIEVASDATHPYAFNDKAYNALIELMADICKRNGKSRITWIADKTKALAYQPAADEMLITVHRWFAAKACPGDWLYNRLGEVADKVNAKLKSSTVPAAPVDTSKYTRIMGDSVATKEQMTAYLEKLNPAVAAMGLPFYYLNEGKLEGVRGDIAFAQSCLETGNFHFAGSAVTLDQNNFCGMGVTSNGMKGNSFGKPQTGIRAQIQHLKAYASKEDLNQECVDPRFKYVTRGSAEYVEWLGQQENPDGKGWATGAGYGEKILKILDAIIATNVDTTPAPVEPTAPSAAEEKPAATMYRVRKTWEDKASQKGAYKILANACKCADANPGYKVFDDAGNVVYPAQATFEPYLVRVDIDYLNIRTGPGNTYATNGQTGKGNFTIVEESEGPGSKTGWGRLKSGAGWISLDYAKKI